MPDFPTSCLKHAEKVKAIALFIQRTDELIISGMENAEGMIESEVFPEERPSCGYITARV